MNDLDGVLTEALDAGAETVRADMLRPLTEPRYRSKRPHPWLAPVAAAAAVALIIGLVVAVTGHFPVQRKASPAAAPAAAPPRYYAEIDIQYPRLQSAIVVRSVATGAMIARPVGPAGLIAAKVAAAPDDRTFYVVYSVNNGFKIYSFSLTARNVVTPMTPIAGGSLNYSGGILEPLPTFAVSPDGANLAVTVSAGRSVVDQRRGSSDVIVVISLRTGVHRVWQGGLYRSGTALSINSLSWAGPATLDFVPSWCKGREVCFPPGDTQIRALSITSDGGSLADSSVLVQHSARYPSIAAIAAGAGGTLSIMTISGPHNSAAVDQVSIAGGAFQRLLYRPRDVPAFANLTFYVLLTDPSGQYLIATVDDSSWEELPGRGAPRPLPGSTGAYSIAWLRNT
jgi:hypothetical protein